MSDVILNDFNTKERVRKALRISYFGDEAENFGWEDDRFQFIARKVDVSSGRLDYDYANCCIGFQSNALYPDDPVCMVQEIPHKTKMNYVFRPHIHWYQEQADTPNWLLGYRFQPHTGTVTEDSGNFSTYTLLIPTGNRITYSSGRILQRTDFPEVDVTGLNISDCIDWVVFRDTDNDSGLFSGTDPVSSRVGCKFMDVHIPIDQARGSAEENAK
jgi:hypothetical protein